VLLELATACRRGERTRLSYRDRQDRDTVRDIDPHRLVRTGHRWYLVALDVARGEWRTFRADWVAEAHPTGHLVRLVDPPDAALLASRMLTSDYPLYTIIRLSLPLDRAMRLVPLISAPAGPTDPTPPSSRSAAPTPTNSPPTCSASQPRCACCSQTTSCSQTRSAKHCAAASETYLTTKKADLAEHGAVHEVHPIDPGACQSRR
jgi:hypothetical protein